MPAHLDIEKFCTEHHLEHAGVGEHHHAHEGWVQLHCPFCADGTHGFHLGYSLSRGNFNCWRCGPHSAWEVAGAVLRTKRADLIGRALARCNSYGALEERQRQAITARHLRPPPNMGPFCRVHRDYLRGRRFSPTALAEEWGLLGTQHLSGSWNWRVVAPVSDATGRVVAYVGRSIRARGPKYKVANKEDCLMDPSELIYGIHKVTGDAVVIVEGPADVWRLGPGAVAALGIGWKRAQANALRKFKRRFVLFDSVDKQTGEVDRNAQRRAAKLAEFLAMFPGETEVVDGFDTDPGDFTDRQARRVMRDLVGG